MTVEARHEDDVTELRTPVGRAFRRIAFRDRSGKALSREDETTLRAHCESACSYVVAEHYSRWVIGYNGLDVSGSAPIAIPIV